jgi:hypothetical protein
MSVLVIAIVYTVVCAQDINITSYDKLPMCTMHILNDTTCPQQAFMWTNETNAQACCATCAASPKCQAWEWFDATLKPIKDHPNCHLKTKPNVPQRKVGCTCGTKVPIQPAPSPAPLPPRPAAAPGSPNIIWFLTDDQDQKLGGSFPMHNGVGPMPKTKIALADKGAMANNWFIHTPICCPSRAELVTGR